MKIMQHGITIVAGFMMVTAISAPGQRIRATATLDSTRILLGDQVNLKLSIEKPDTLLIDFADMPDTLAGKIEVLKRFPVDTTTYGNKDIKLEQTFLVTCFDSGIYRIPPFKFNLKLAGRNDSVFSNELYMRVLTMKIDTTKGPVDIKMPYDAPLTLKEVTPYILGIILAGAILFLLIYSIKRKKKNLPLFIKPTKPREPAHITALRELDRIREEKLWQKDKFKEYYSELTEVLRIYIEERFAIPAMEQTTYEIISSFNDSPGLISEKQMNLLGQVLPLADLVKFAKYRPLSEDHNLSLVNSYFFVNETKIEEPQKPEKSVSEEETGQEVTLK